MIRYVLAIVLTTALLGIGVAGVDHVATVRSEAQVERQLAEIESAVTALRDTEELTPPGQPGARRVVELDLPADRFASRRATTLRLQPDPRGITTIEYRVGDRMTRTKHVEAIVRNRETATGTTDLSGRTGRVTLALSLVAARADSENDTAAHVALAVRDGG